MPTQIAVAGAMRDMRTCAHGHHPCGGAVSLTHRVKPFEMNHATEVDMTHGVVREEVATRRRFILPSLQVEARRAAWHGKATHHRPNAQHGAVPGHGADVADHSLADLNVAVQIVRVEAPKGSDRLQRGGWG